MHLLLPFKINHMKILFNFEMQLLVLILYNTICLYKLVKFVRLTVDEDPYQLPC